jgi:FKBP-type peptidyl-prolyl cis-trans isomerase SlyD
MTIKKDKVVSIIYDLRIDSPEGEIVESLNQDKPLTFLYGSGNLLPKFEENISGLKLGDSFDFDLAVTDAYGEVNETAIVDVPISAFEIDGKLDEDLVKLGNTIPMRDNAGNRLNGVVKEISSENVKMDFNHPLAGNHLYFKGQVTEVREATEEELSHGHVHSGCGCGSGGCGSHSHEESCGCGDEHDHHGGGGCGSGSCGC